MTEFNMKEVRETVKMVLVPMFYKETQLGRSLREQNPVFKKELYKSIKKLSKKVEEGTLKNSDIRREIKRVRDNSGVTIGQSQKVINVFLKYYCILSNKPKKIIKELDSPLDSKIMSKFKTKKVKQISLRNMDDFDVYMAWQNRLEVLGAGIRLKPDIETYDEDRIKKFHSE